MKNTTYSSEPLQRKLSREWILSHQARCCKIAKLGREFFLSRPFQKLTLQGQLMKLIQKMISARDPWPHQINNPLRPPSHRINHIPKFSDPRLTNIIPRQLRKSLPLVSPVLSVLCFRLSLIGERGDVPLRKSQEIDFKI